MSTKLKGLKITSTDLVEQGANPDAHIRLFKRQGESGDDVADGFLQKAVAALQGVFVKSTPPEPVGQVEKDAKTFDDEMERVRRREITCQLWDFCYALSDSLSSIICDGEMSEDGKRDMMLASLNEFSEVMRNAIPVWAAGEKVESDGSVVAKSALQQAAGDELFAKYSKLENGDEDGTDPDDDSTDSDVEAGSSGNKTKKTATSQQKEETDTMKIDKSKMTPEERAAFEAIEKKYGTNEVEAVPAPITGDGDVAKGAASATPASNTNATDLHPEVKKALDENAALRTQMEAMQKSLEIKDLTAVAKKYEILGKKSDELAPKLYDMKKAGGTAFDDYVALLDEQLTMVEKGGVFGEIGTARSGASGTQTELGAMAAEIQKSNVGMTSPEAIIKAFEQNPQMAAQYESEYNTGRVR